MWVQQEVKAETQAASLQGVTWTLVTMNGHGASPKNPLTIEFGADWTVTGSGGINRFSGSCTTATGEVRFTPMVATKMGGSPERMKMEQEYFDAIAQVRNFSLQGGLLRLRDDSKKTILEFSR